LASSKVDVPKKHFDLLFTPVACVVSITTVDSARQSQCGIIRDLRESASRAQQMKKTQIPVSIAHDIPY
jgi:hypothetical protein